MSKKHIKNRAKKKTENKKGKNSSSDTVAVTLASCRRCSNRGCGAEID